jgi:hypothetical protein
VGKQGSRGVRPRGPCGQLTQAEAHLCQQAKDRRSRCLKNLARLARLDPKLLYPLKHRGEESQAHMAIVRSREALGWLPHAARQPRVRGVVKSFGAPLPRCPAVSFHKNGTEHIPETLWPALGPSWSSSARSHSVSASRTESWRRSLKHITPKPSSCARSRESGRSRRLPSCSP